MLYITNQNQPGVIVSIGKFTAEEGINIANMHLGRREGRGDAISLLELDTTLCSDDLSALREIEYICDAHYLNFNMLSL